MFNAGSQFESASLLDDEIGPQAKMIRWFLVFAVGRCRPKQEKEGLRLVKIVRRASAPIAGDLITFTLSLAGLTQCFCARRQPLMKLTGKMERNQRVRVTIGGGSQKFYCGQSWTLRNMAWLFQE